MKSLIHFFYETSPFDPFWSALFAGFCVVGIDGVVYMTDAGEEYLEGLET